MGGPSLTLTGDASPLREMTRKVRRALGKADTQELLATIGSEIVATTKCSRCFDRCVQCQQIRLGVNGFNGADFCFHTLELFLEF